MDGHVPTWGLAAELYFTRGWMRTGREEKENSSKPVHSTPLHSTPLQSLL